MSLLSLLYALLIGPLELFFEVLYALAFRIIDDPGLAIVFLSLAMNFLVLPLYRRADAMQEAERQRVAKMKPWNDHIKKTFKGDERFMMQQTYNRQCGHKPTDALKGSVSLLLEIPFFIAAYHFLSNLSLLQGVSFGPITNLGAPDALLVVGDVSINVLPILMTAINLASAVIYMKGLPLSNKIQMYGIAAIFLVLLYNSPAGLVFYWTLNNVFSLVKNIFYRMKNPGFVLSVMASAVGVVLLGYCLVVHSTAPFIQLLILIVAGLALQIPIVRWAVRRRGVQPLSIPDASPTSRRTFIFCALFLALLTGAIIPLAVISSSPSEFAATVGSLSPLWYVVRSLAMALGTFVLWFGVFYWLMSPRGKTVFCCIMVALAGVAVLDYLAFVPDLGNLSVDLQYDNVMSAGLRESLVNLVAVAAISAVLIVLYLRRDKLVRVAAASLCVAAVAMSVVGAAGIYQDLSTMVESNADDAHVAFSAEGRNVVVIMMDREIGYLLPYLINEKPELREGLAGFTYYPNAVSYGVFTNVGSPGLYGGYDYTPEAMNARSDELLADKHDEALKVMPKIFMDNGFEATFFDPTYAGYSTTPDLSIFDDMPELNTYITMDGTWDTREGLSSQASGSRSARERNFFCYSLLRTSPIALRQFVYHRGDYNSADALSGDSGFVQVADGSSKSSGLDANFMTSYSVLQHLSDMTSVQEDDRDVLFIMSNDTTHSPSILQEPDYIPALTVDNTAFDEEHRRRYAEDGSYIELPEESGDKEASPTMHYEVGMAALRELCNWFDYLRDNGVWDNTRIIVVSDHGRGLGLNSELVVPIGEGENQKDQDLLMANCMLMVKDFGAEEFTIDETFMTNADTPALAMKDIVENPANPYTGNPITTNDKDDGIRMLFSYDWDVAKNNGNTFIPGHWLSVHDNIYDLGNWEYLGYY